MSIDKIIQSLLLLVVRQLRFPTILVLFGFGLLFLSNCAYYNTFYNARKYYREGAARQRTNPTQAKTSFDKAIEKSALVISNYPQSKYVPEALFIIGMSNYYTGQYTKAIDKFENLLLVFPGYERVNEANLYWAAALIEMQEYNQAIERLQVLDSRKTSREIQELAMFKTAELYFFRKEYSEAIPLLKNFLTKYPKSEKYYQILLMLGDSERAERDFSSAITTYETCLEKTRERIGRDAADTSQLYTRVTLHLAECFIEADRQTEGLEIINRVVAADTLPNAKSKLSGKVFLDLGNLFLRLNEPEKARFYLRKVTSMPEQVEAFYRLANSYESEAKFDTAKVYYDSVVKKQATSEFGTLAQSRLELLKLVVSDFPPLPAPKDTNVTKSEPIKKPEEPKKPDEIEKEREKEMEKFEHMLLPDSVELELDDLDELDTPDADTLTPPVESLPTEPARQDTLSSTIKTTSPQIDSAAIQFHIAEIYNLNLKQYERAITEYEKVFNQYPQSVFAPKALFAQAWLYKNILGAAADTNQHNLKYRQVLDKIIVNYPDTEYARQAQTMRAELENQE